MKNTLLIAIVFFLYSCGYTSVYKNIDKKDLQLIITEMQGDKEINNLLKNQINLYSNKSSDNKIKIEIDSEYKKIAIAKDSAGVISDYKLLADVTMIINKNNKTQKITFNEAIKIKKQTDSFEQNRYEKNIKSNFSSSIKDKLIIKIISME